MTSPDSVLAAVARVRRRLTFVLLARVVLQSVGLGLGAWLLSNMILSERLAAGVSPLVMAVGTLCLAVISAGVLARRCGFVSALRAALWIEEHHESGYALVTWVEQSQHADPPTARLAQVVEQASRASLARAHHILPSFARSQIAGPLLFSAGASVLMWFAIRGTTFSALDGLVVTVGPAARDARRPTPVGAWDVRVTPPAYTGLPTVRLGNVASVRALSGSRLDVVGRDAIPDSVRVRVLADSASDNRALPLTATGSGWQGTISATAAPLELRVWRDRFARLLLVEGTADSIPRVSLIAPARDSVLRSAEGMVLLEASVHDDLGLARASFEVVISSGDGERFTVRAVQAGARSLDGARDGVLRTTLDLRALQLHPGDVVHLRAIARDAHPAADREAGTSDTRSIRIARQSEYDSLAVEPAPPPEVDQSLLSQRMLLMLTERLVQRRSRLTSSAVNVESSRLARDQARLRQAVGDAVFQRLTGEASGEHAHFAGDGHDHGIESMGGKLALTGTNVQGVLAEGDDAPVVAINKPLLEAYNAMWDAGRALEQSEPHAAIPFMRQALEAIERARAASRLYLRGRPPVVIIDLAKVRMTGKDVGAPGVRAVRAPLPVPAIAREARLLSAAALTTTNSAAARDSLAVLRLESLKDAPAFAEALSAVLDAFARGAGADVTAPFLRARRALGGVARVPSVAWSRGSPP